MADVEEVLREALDRGEEGDWEGMAGDLRDALGEHPGDPRLLCWLGVAERELGMEGVAYERFRACLAADPRDPHVLATAGSALAAFDDPGAEAALRTAAMLAPDLPLARWMYGAYLSREGLLPEAVAELETALALDPEDPAIQLEMGVARALSGDTAGAADAFARGVDLDPRDGWARALLGLALVEQGRLDEAAAELHRAAGDRPDDVEVLLLAAVAAAAEGWEETALELLERARVQGRGADAGAVLEAEEHMDLGPEAARGLLVSTLAPAAFRERLMTRP